MLGAGQAKAVSQAEVSLEGVPAIFVANGAEAHLGLLLNRSAYLQARARLLLNSRRDWFPRHSLQFFALFCGLTMREVEVPARAGVAHLRVQIVLHGRLEIVQLLCECNLVELCVGIHRAGLS